jgi:hypothetical protein
VTYPACEKKLILEGVALEQQNLILKTKVICIIRVCHEKQPGHTITAILPHAKLTASYN